MDEAFDCWHQGKNPYDYRLYFEAWWRRDFTAMVRRDQNHASVLFFSIGNEIPQGLSAKGVREAVEIAAFIRALDPQRHPLTMGFNKGWDDPRDPRAAQLAVLGELDVPGNNYDCTGYDTFHAAFPGKAMLTTESGPAQSYAFTVGGVQNWSSVGGDFIWTAIDHIGETSIGFAAASGSIEAAWGSLPFPHDLNFAGDLDIAGGIKPQSLYRQVLWGVRRLALSVHRPGSRAYWQAWGWDDEVPSWSWPASDVGKPAHVRIYSRCKAVAVTLNGDDVATVHPSAANKYNASVVVWYAPGTLSAACIGDDGGVDASSATSLTSSGPPYALRLAADRATIGASGDDLAYVTVSVLDASGVLCDHQRHAAVVGFEVAGDGTLFRVGSGDPVDTDSFMASRRSTWRENAIAVLRPRPGAGGGAITLTASASGLASATATVRVQQKSKRIVNDLSAHLVEPHALLSASKVFLKGDDEGIPAARIVVDTPATQREALGPVLGTWSLGVTYLVLVRMLGT